ncbi:MAG: GNAT family N-acetyltransferase [Phaeodactylibacter sp.]|nr:GNAT family N-acetyltransferase [Phaeodactylibacter sp.]MCB9052274.1 GNAT family N-acetyltransferase [Lewinellaceae bacterium]
MKATIYPNAVSFLNDNLALLEREEAANNLILGIALGIHQGISVFKDAHFWGISKGGRPVYCAVQTPPRNLLVYGNPEDAEACAGLIHGLVVRQGMEVPGVIGPRAVIEPFVMAWQKKTGGSWQMKQAMGVFQLDKVIPPAGCGGRLRAVGPEDQALAYEWICAFQLEALGERGEEFAQQLVKRHLERGDLFFWEDPGPVSMAAATRPTRNGITINAVYTPPEHRGKGYASNCVAQLSQNMLDKGHLFCALFTNLNNPTSNKIYQAIGYRKVAEFLEVRFGESPSL